MNCQIDPHSGELCGFSPNIEFLKASLESSMPERISGTLIVSTSHSGALLRFAGAKEWRELRVDSEVIPRWMFAEMAFRELISLRVQTFVALLEQMQPCIAMVPENVRSSEVSVAG